MFFRLLLYGVTFGVVGVLPVWFILATKQPVLSSVGLVAVGACAGYCLGRVFHDDVGIWTTATATEAMAVVVSLLVIRSCGYRLVRLALSCAGDRSAKSNAC
jgi:prolipoprotein diacylglyceryltransferase